LRTLCTTHPVVEMSCYITSLSASWNVFINHLNGFIPVYVSLIVLYYQFNSTEKYLFLVESVTKIFLFYLRIISQWI